jgi:hypothetical protein
MGRSGDWSWCVIPGLWALFLGALYLVVHSITKAIRDQGEETRNLTTAHTARMEQRLDVVHDLVNSNLTSVKAALEQANYKIVSLEKSIVELGDARRIAEHKLAEEKL